MFGVNLPTFLGLRKDFGGGYSAGNNSNELTGKEILDALMGGSGGISSSGYWSGGLSQVLQSNLRNNAGMLVASVVGIPIAFNIGKKLLNKPIILPANRMLKSIGVAKDVKI